RLLGRLLAWGSILERGGWQPAGDSAPLWQKGHHRLYLAAGQPGGAAARLARSVEQRAHNDARFRTTLDGADPQDSTLCVLLHSSGEPPTERMRDIVNDAAPHNLAYGKPKSVHFITEQQLLHDVLVAA